MIMNTRIRLYSIYICQPKHKIIILYSFEMDGRIILKSIMESSVRGMDWIQLAYYKVQYWVLVNMVMNLCVP
jgi:hypothetical protein